MENLVETLKRIVQMLEEKGITVIPEQEEDTQAIIEAGIGHLESVVEQL